MRALTAASRDIIRDTKAAVAPRKNEGATAFEKICVSLSMSGTNSMLQLLHPLAWCEFAISISFLSREHRLMSAARGSDAALSTWLFESQGTKSLRDSPLKRAPYALDRSRTSKMPSHHGNGFLRPCFCPSVTAQLVCRPGHKRPTRSTGRSSGT